MKQADFIYREMLLCEARKCKYPRLAGLLVKCFWWMGDDKFFVPFIVVALSISTLLILAGIVHVAWMVVQTFFLVG